MINAAVLSHTLAAAGDGGITTGDVLAAAISIFIFIIVPLLVWAVRSLINEGKRRTEDSLNMAATKESNEDIRDMLKEHIDKEEKTIAIVQQDVAGLKAVVGFGGFNGRARE